MSRKSELPRDNGDAGFTLLEALIAMVVLTLLAAVLLRGVVGVRADAAWFDDHMVSTLVATSVLDEALANRRLHDGVYGGERDGRRYTLTASAVNLSAQLPPARPDPEAAPSPNPNGVPAPAAAAPPATLWRPQRVVVSVDAPSRPVTLETIRLAAVAP